MARAVSSCTWPIDPDRARSGTIINATRRDPRGVLLLRRVAASQAPMESNISRPAFWEEIYRGGRAGWDLGGPTPAIRRWLQAGRWPPGRLMILGAGRGHDAREFARHGFAVTAVDFAADAA